tara:strand:- start:679 stop:3078 length:2400 start_codon:yes stop_codon:yes gene_type:complete
MQMKNMSWRNILKDEAVENFGSSSSNIIEDVDKILYDILDEQVKEIKDKSKDFEKQWDSATAKIPGVKGNVGGKFISEIYEQTLMNSMNYFINKRRSDVYMGIYNAIKSNTAIPLVNDFDNETFKANVSVSPLDYFSALMLKPESDDDSGLGNLFDRMKVDSSSWDSTRSIFRSRLIKIIDKNTANHKMKIFEPSEKGPSESTLLPNASMFMNLEGRDRNILYAKVPIDGAPPATFKISLREFLVMLINVNKNEIVETYRLFLNLVSRVNEKLKSFWGVDKDYMLSGGRDIEYEEANTFFGFSPEELGEGIERTLVSGVVRAQKNINDTVKNLKQIEVVGESTAKYDRRLYTYGELGATPPEGKTAKDIVETFTDKTKKLTRQEIKQRDDVDLTGLNIMQGDKKIGILLYKIVIPVKRGEDISKFLSSKERQMIDYPSLYASAFMERVSGLRGGRAGRVMPVIFIGTVAEDSNKRNRTIESYVEAPSIKTIGRIFTEPESYNYPTPSELVATGFASDTVTDFLPSVTSSEFARLVYHEPSERNFIEYKFTIPLIEFENAKINYRTLEDTMEDGLISFKNYLIQNNLLKQENAFRITEDITVDFMRYYRGTINNLSGVGTIYNHVNHYLGWQNRSFEGTETLFQMGDKYNIDIVKLLTLSGLKVKKFECKIFLDVFGAMRSRGEKGQRTRSSQYGDYTVSLGQPHLCFYSDLKSGKIYPETGGGDVCIVLSSNVPVADAVGPISLQLLQLVNILEDFSKEFDIRKFTQLKPMGIQSDLSGKFASIIGNSEVKPVGDVKVV